MKDIFDTMTAAADKTDVDLSKNYYLDNSDIHGTGAFASKDMSPEENIGTAIETYGLERGEVVSNYKEGADFSRTELGRKVNHQFKNNSILTKDDKNYNLRSTKNIKKGSEITANYKETPDFIDSNTDGFKEMDKPYMVAKWSDEDEKGVSSFEGYRDANPEEIVLKDIQRGTKNYNRNQGRRGSKGLLNNE